MTVEIEKNCLPNRKTMMTKFMLAQLENTMKSKVTKKKEQLPSTKIKNVE